MIHIPGYRISRLLGEGGMAKVYLAVQESFDREVAIKIMAPHLAHGDAQYGERFVREARIVAQLMHPNIVTVFEVGVHDGQHYLSMQYVPGRDLRNRREQLSLRQNLEAVKQIALALDFAHSKGYVHRDIKPENILIHDHDGRAILTDFGIARLTGSNENLTQTGTAIGTPAFMSPEQALGRSVDHRSDLYSMGIVLFYLLVGNAPFTAETPVALGLKHAVEPPPRLEGAFLLFQPLLDKLLAKLPEKRLQSGKELADAIDQLLVRLKPETEQLWRASFANGQPIATTSAATVATPTVPPIPVANLGKQEVTSISRAATKHASAPTTTGHQRLRQEQPTPRPSRSLTPWIGVLVLMALLAVGWLQQEQLLTLLNNDTVVQSPVQHIPANLNQTVVKVVEPQAQATAPAPIEPSANPPEAEPIELTTDQKAALALEKAREHIAAGRLTEPADDNAEFQFREALRLTPESASAKEGWLSFGVALAQRGLRLAESGDLTAGERDFEKAILIAPRERDVLLLKQRLPQIRAEFEADGFVEKATLALQNNQYFEPSPTSAYDWYQKALSVYQAHKPALEGLQQLEKNTAARIRLLWQKKQFVDASTLLTQAEQKFRGSDIIQAAADDTVFIEQKRKRQRETEEQELQEGMNAEAEAKAHNLVHAQITHVAVEALSNNGQSSTRSLQAKISFAQFARGPALLRAKLFDETHTTVLAEKTVSISGPQGNKLVVVAQLNEQFTDGTYHLDVLFETRRLATVSFKVGQ